MAGLSSVFKYISHFRHAGHQVGRKVGDMLEILVFGSLYSNDELRRRLQIEPKLFGFSDAGHKVEFVLHKNPINPANGRLRSGGEIKNLTGVSAFIECKKVGVEQTVNGNFKRSFRSAGRQRHLVPFGSRIPINFSPRGGARHSFAVQVEDNGRLSVIKDGNLIRQDQRTSNEHFRYVFAVCENGEAHLFENERSLRDLAPELAYARILEFHDQTREGVVAILNDCLAGPQTPEKAKQASFVALDVRKARTGSFDKRDNEQDLLSVLVLTEVAHWEKKSRNMINACIDLNLYVPDNIIVSAFEEFERVVGEEFYDRISKEAFSNDQNIQEICRAVAEHYNHSLFRDLNTGAYLVPDFLDDRPVFRPA